MSDTDYFQNHALFNPEARAKAFEELVRHVYDDDANASFSLVIPQHLQRYAIGKKFNDVLNESLRHWLGDYFPGKNITFGTMQSLIEDHPEDEPDYQMIDVKVDGTDARESLTLLINGMADELPDYHPVVVQAYGVDSKVQHLMERVAAKPLPEGRNSMVVRFSIPKGRDKQFEGDLGEHYGKDLQFTQPIGMQCMVTLCAILKGETARRFMADYEKFKGREQ